MNERLAATSDIDALFKLPLAEFTGARNALAAQLKKAGRKAEANEVKALAKPSVSAWVVNQLYWRRRELIDRLIEAGDRLREAQVKPSAKDSSRALIVARRDAVAALEQAAAEILRDGDHGGARDLLRRVTSTLEALSSYGSRPGTPAVGRLTGDLEPPGFEAAASLFSGGDKRAPVDTPARARSAQTQPVKKPLRAVDRNDRRDEKKHKGLVAAAKAAVQQADRALSVARKQAQVAAAKLDTATMRAKSTDEQVAQIEQRLAQAVKDADAAHRHASEAAANATKATHAAEAAERELELARRRLHEVEGKQG